MENKQAKLVLALGKKLARRKRTVEESTISLKASGIIDSTGNISKNYPNLRTAMRSK